MKLLRHLTLAATLMAAMTYLPASAKNVVVPKAYMFGFVASFNDSTVYFTDIQEVDSVWFYQKKKILAGRSNYAYQLRDYFAQQRDQPKRTCVVICNQKRKKVEKIYTKMMKMYTSSKKGNTYDVRYVPLSEFKFESVNMDDSDK